MDIFMDILDSCQSLTNEQLEALIAQLEGMLAEREETSND